MGAAAVVGELVVTVVTTVVVVGCVRVGVVRVPVGSSVGLFSVGWIVGVFGELGAALGSNDGDDVSPAFVGSSVGSP